MLSLVALAASPAVQAKDPPAPATDPKAPAAKEPKGPAATDPKGPAAQDPKPKPKPKPKDPPAKDPPAKDPPPKDPKGGKAVPKAGGSRNWDFESGLAGWTATGDAFTSQPTVGDNVLAGRVRTEMTLARGGIGGDYWRGVSHPIGHHLEAWIGTAENHPSAGTPLGAIHAGTKTGTLTSGEFPLDNAHRFIAFMVGGGRDVATQRVELQVFGEDKQDLAALTRLIEQHRDAAVGLAALFTGRAPGAVNNGVGKRDGSYIIALSASGQDSELMRQIVFDVPASLRGRRARIRIVDDGGGKWGHINVDDFRFGATQPAPRAPRVWGFADTHAHPMNDLAFGGNVVQGSMYARGSSSGWTDEGRKAALPPMFERVNWVQLGSIAGLLSPIYAGGSSAMPGFPPLDPLTGAILGAASREGTRTMRSGYPQLQGYPTSSQMLGQTMYGEWVRRAYDGGLRLMSALAVNNWLVSSHPIKRSVLGSPAPEDDRRSAVAQIRDIKAWAQRPENRSWVEIAFTPADARRIIAENKLAIVLGVELDTLGNFVPNNRWKEDGAVVMPNDARRQRELIAKELDDLHELGVRQVGAFHYVSGVFGGTAMSERMFNEVNRKITGDNVDVESGDAEGIRYRLDVDAWGVTGTLGRTVATGDGPGRQSERSWGTTRRGHINRMGLTPTGAILFDELAKRGMLVDLDHASLNSTKKLLELASARDYPVLSSHSDYMELGFTGREDFTHNLVDNDDADNLRRFDTTTIGPLRHEAMVTRTKLTTIARLGGTTGAIMWLPRRKPWPGGAPNDCDGSSKTWAQSYEYAVEMTGGHGVALATDRVTVYPRFGPNACYLLGLETNGMTDRDQRRFRHVDAQRHGVRYDQPIRDWRAYRFRVSSPTSAWQATPAEGSSWESRPNEHGNAWIAIAAWAAGKNPRVEGHGIDGPAAVIDYALGFGSSVEADLEYDKMKRQPNLNRRFAAYCVRKGITPNGLTRFRNADGIWQEYRWVKRVWDEWQRMEGRNAPLRRHLFGDRDFDVNIDGVAHYGMLPDFLQDVANSHPSPAQVGQYMAPLFRSAEDYIQMWEKAERVR
jgi:microsomal dipeptidase-like Zn-dependent dipeptidase